MALVERVQSILTRPRATWPIVLAERDDAASLYSRYVVPLALIPAVAGFIGWSLVGAGTMGDTFRLPIMAGLMRMVIGYLVSLGMVWVLAQIVAALAPTFGGTKDPLAALKLVAYASTAGFVGGIFGLIPALSLLGLIASLYSVYLLYTGIPVMMRCPPGKAVAYTAVVVVCAFLVTLAVSFVLSRLQGLGGPGIVGV